MKTQAIAIVLIGLLFAIIGSLLFDLTELKCTAGALLCLGFLTIIIVPFAIEDDI